MHSERQSLGNFIPDNYKTLLLADGRNLAYAEYGLPNGCLVLFFHGSPGSSLLHADMAETAAQLGVRLVAVDRPGYGASTAHPQRTLLTVADDVALLCDALGIDKCSPVGFSGGTPYPLAFAARHPGRVNKIALVGTQAPLAAPGVCDGMPPMVQGLYALAQNNPDELRAAFAALAPSPAALLQTMAASVSAWDKQLVLERQTEFEAEYARTLQQGTEGLVRDFILVSGDWGFSLRDISAEVHLWFGTADQNTPPAMAHYLAGQLPNNRMHTLDGEGHCVLYPHWREILGQIV